MIDGIQLLPHVPMRIGGLPSRYCDHCGIETGSSIKDCPARRLKAWSEAVEAEDVAAIKEHLQDVKLWHSMTQTEKWHSEL